MDQRALFDTSGSVLERFASAIGVSKEALAALFILLAERLGTH